MAPVPFRTLASSQMRDAVRGQRAGSVGPPGCSLPLICSILGPVLDLWSHAVRVILKLKQLLSLICEPEFCPSRQQMLNFLPLHVKPGIMCTPPWL